MNPTRRCDRFLFALLAATIGCAAPPDGSPVESGPRAPEHRLDRGTGSFLFTGSAGARERAVRVHYHVPPSTTAESPIVFVMHGNSRTAEGYRDVWIPIAEERGFLLVVPEFSRQEYPSSRQYHQGNLLDADGAAVDSARWSFVTIEGIFDEVQARAGSRRDRYRIYGHSAGGQFVHRLLLMMPEARIESAVAANAGWYTLPTEDASWPYGLGDLEAAEPVAERLRSAFARPVTILLGEADTLRTQSSLRRTPEAMAQGEHRLERGHHFFRLAREAARARGLAFEWTLETVPGAEHSNAQMARAAAAILAP